MGKKPVYDTMTPARALALALLLLDCEIHAARRTRQYTLVRECRAAVEVLRQMKAAEMG